MPYDRSIALTLALLRQELGRTLREMVLGTVDSGTTSTIMDTDLVDSGESDTVQDRGWVKVNGEVIRLASFVASTGTLTLSRPLSVAATGQYETHRLLSPNELDDCINRALSACFYEREQVITIVADQTEYDLSSYEWITSRNQVTGVFIRSGDVATEYQYLQIPKARISRKTSPEIISGSMPYTGIYLQIKPAYSDAYYIVVRGACPFSVLGADSQTTTCPWDLVTNGAEMNAYRLLTMDGPATDREQYKAKAKEASFKFAMACRQWLQRPQHTVLSPDDVYYDN